MNRETHKIHEEVLFGRIYRIHSFNYGESATINRVEFEAVRKGFIK